MAYFRMAIEIMIRIGGKIGNASLDGLFANPKWIALPRDRPIAAGFLGLDVNGRAIREFCSRFQHYHVTFDRSTIDHDITFQ